MRIVKTIVLLLIVLGLPASAGEAGFDSKTFEEVVKPMLDNYCVSCHGAEKQKARLRYDQMDGFRISDRHLWTAIHEQLSDGEMPPEDEPQPASSQKKKVLAWIEREQRALGAGSTRRLNRREFGAALQDVTGLSVDFSYTIPGDSKVDGFDTGAEALQDAADSVDQMMEVTRRAVEGIRFLEPPPGEVLKVDLVNLEKNPHKAFDPWTAAGISLEKLPRIAKPGLGALVEPKWPRDRSSSLFSIPPPPDRRGLVRVKFSVASYCTFPEVPNPILWVKIGGRVMDRQEITGPMDLEYQVQIEDTIIGKKGLSIGFTPRVEMAYRVKGFENEDRSKPNQTCRMALGFSGRPGTKRNSGHRSSSLGRFVVLKQVKLEPRYVAAWPPASWNIDLGEIGDNRRERGETPGPVDGSGLPAPGDHRRARNGVLRLLREAPGPRHELRSGPAVHLSISVLMSSPFRYLDSTAHEDKVIADHAVASRLSFMLVGAPPDAELRELAAAGKLRRPDVLKAQADRLLNDIR